MGAATNVAQPAAKGHGLPERHNPRWGKNTRRKFFQKRKPVGALIAAARAVHGRRYERYSHAAKGKGLLAGYSRQRKKTPDGSSSKKRKRYADESFPKKER